jgi:acetoin utilization protein AcuB
MNVGRHMQSGPVTVLPDAPISEARDLMEEHGYGLLLVATSDGILEGFITRAGLRGVKDWELPAGRVSHPAKFAVSPGDTLEKAALIMLANRLVILPVVDKDRLVGVISQGELLKGLAAALGVGLEATRLTIKLANGLSDLYASLDVLRAHNARIVSLIRGSSPEEPSEIIVRIQEIADKEKLLQDLESALTAG